MIRNLQHSSFLSRQIYLYKLNRDSFLLKLIQLFRLEHWVNFSFFICLINRMDRLHGSTLIHLQYSPNCLRSLKTKLTVFVNTGQKMTFWHNFVYLSIRKHRKETFFCFYVSTYSMSLAGRSGRCNSNLPCKTTALFPNCPFLTIFPCFYSLIIFFVLGFAFFKLVFI